MRVLREDVKSTSTALCAVTRGDTPLDSPFRVQRDRDQRTKSWGTRQRHAKANVVEDVARAAPVTIGAAHALTIAPEGAAPQDAGRFCTAPADLRASPALLASQDRDSHPPGSASTPRCCHSILPHHRGWHRVENIPLRLWYLCLFHRSWRDSDQTRCPRDTHVHQYRVPLSPTQPHSAGSPASLQCASKAASGLRRVWPLLAERSVNHWQYATASCQLTHTTGWFSCTLLRLLLYPLGDDHLLSTKARNCATVTG